MSAADYSKTECLRCGGSPKDHPHRYRSKGWWVVCDLLVDLGNLAIKTTVVVSIVMLLLTRCYGVDLK